MIRAQHDPNGITVWRYDNLPNGERSYWTNDGKRRTVRPNDPAPWWLVLDPDDADALINVLSDFATIRTPEYAYIEGELKATKLHLSDMRKIAILEPPTGLPDGDES